MAKSLLNFLVLFLVTGCSTQVNNTRTPLADTNRTRSVNPSDWGPAYVEGMEYGPASREHSIAMHKAESFMSQQKFATQYAKRACSVGGSELIDAHFALLSDKSGKTYGVVRVNMKTGECSWLGEPK
ncbi:MAG: hypothetical protein ABSG22_11150 [Sedimentisphaerales bacterium]